MKRVGEVSRVSSRIVARVVVAAEVTRRKCFVAENPPPYLGGYPFLNSLLGGIGCSVFFTSWLLRPSPARTSAEKSSREGLKPVSKRTCLLLPSDRIRVPLAVNGSRPHTGVLSLRRGKGNLCTQWKRWRFCAASIGGRCTRSFAGVAMDPTMLRT